MSKGEQHPQRACWYCQLEGRQVGPLSDRQLRDLRDTGQLSRSDSIKKGSDGKWVPAERIKGLFPTADSNSVAKSESTREKVSAPRESTDVDSTDRSLLDPLAAGTAGLEVAKSNPYLPVSPKTAEPSAIETNPQPLANAALIKWLAIGGGGIALLSIAIGVLWMRRSSDSEVRVTAVATDQQIETEQTASEPIVAETNRPPISELQAPVSERVVSARDDFDAEQLHAADSNANPYAVTDASSALLPSPDTSPTEQGGNVAVSDMVNDAITMTADSAVAQPSVKTPSKVIAEQTSSAPAQPMSESDATVEVEAKGEVGSSAKPRISFGTGEAVAHSVEATAAAQTAVTDARRSQEATQAKNDATVISAMVKQRLDQMAERAGLGQEMEANRKQFAAAMNAIRIANEDLPKMRNQYQVTQNSLRESIARSQQGANRGRIDVASNQLEAELRQMQQFMAQVTASGNAALLAKPKIEQQRAEQNRKLADLQQREGTIHTKLMESIDPYGHQSKQHREQLLDQAVAWDEACIEGCLLRGLTALHEDRLPTAFKDLSTVVERLDGVLKDRSGSKDSPERRILQVALTGLGWTKFRMKQEPEAMKDLGKAIAVSDHYTFPAVIRGMIEAERNRHDAAMRDFETARRLGDADASREAARLLLNSPTIANPKRALTFAEEACGKATSWANHEVHATGLVATGQAELAKATYEKAIELAPTDQIDRLSEEVARLQ